MTSHVFDIVARDFVLGKVWLSNRVLVSVAAKISRARSMAVRPAARANADAEKEERVPGSEPVVVTVLLARGVDLLLVHVLRRWVWVADQAVNAMSIRTKIKTIDFCVVFTAGM